MSHRAPKQGNRLAADDVRIYAQPSNTRPSKPASKKPTKTKRLPTAPKPPADLTASKEILSLFQQTFSTTLSLPDLHTLLQSVKSHLFNRDYSSAFGTPQNLQAYIVRWSPSRALCYRSVFLELCEELKDVFDVASRGGETTEVVCFGGGAGAELVACAAAVKALLPRKDPKLGEEVTGGLHMTGVDIAGWGEAFKELYTGIKESYLPNGIFSADFVQADVLDVDLAALIPSGTRLVSLLFTTNELYTQSRAGTTKMLLGLAGCVEKGCLLVVLESAGSYSMVKVGEKTFSMGLLLDHTLVGGGSGEWEKIVEHEARWYRLPQAQMVNGQTVGTGLRYPLTLENMRYFVRVFRRL